MGFCDTQLPGCRQAICLKIMTLAPEASVSFSDVVMFAGEMEEAALSEASVQLQQANRYFVCFCSYSAFTAMFTGSSTFPATSRISGRLVVS